MNNPIETIEYKGKTINIYVDVNAESPREWDNLGNMCLFHNKYNLPNELNLSMEDTHKIAKNKKYITLPVYMIDHGNVALSTEPYSDPWDSGCLGIITVSREKLKTEGISTRRAKTILKSEVQIFGKFLNGEVYGFECEDVSSWGYYSIEDAIKVAKENI